MNTLLKNACDELQISIKDDQIEKLLIFKDILLEWNEKINLTTITKDEDVILKHFIDSLTVCKFIDFNNKKFIDVGTGAGLPAIPIKILHQTSSPTLLDSLNKRINFLKDATDRLSLDNITFTHSRAEDGGQNKEFREKYDVCVARAVAKLGALAEYTLPFVKIGGEFVALKGPLVYSELDDAKGAIKMLGGEISRTEDIKIPFTDITHTLVFIKKIKQTPNQYPRKAGKVPQNPIK